MRLEKPWMEINLSHFRSQSGLCALYYLIDCILSIKSRFLHFSKLYFGLPPQNCIEIAYFYLFTLEIRTLSSHFQW